MKTQNGGVWTKRSHSQVASLPLSPYLAVAREHCGTFSRFVRVNFFTFVTRYFFEFQFEAINRCNFVLNFYAIFRSILHIPYSHYFLLFYYAFLCSFAINFCIFFLLSRHDYICVLNCYFDCHALAYWIYCVEDYFK